MVDLIEVSSSNVAKVGHNPETNDLHVHFKNGGHYVYSGVSPSQYADLVGAKSIGSHLHSIIKSKCAARKVD